MPELGGMGKLFVIVGAGLVVIGGLIMLLDKLAGSGSGFGWFGRLPGDIFVKRDHFTFYFPLATSILISIGLSLVFYVVSTFFKR